MAENETNTKDNVEDTTHSNLYGPLSEEEESCQTVKGNESITSAVGTTEETQLDIKKNERRVFFPDGDDIILAYHEHPSPWHTAAECTSEALVVAYKHACAKYDVKPLSKLLQQLHAIANFSERNETLTLRSERLDHRHCETLEEVLRRVQFRTIDLEATHLDDESAIALFDMIEYYHSATRVNISYNKLGIRGWQSCSRMLKKTACIEQLDAKCCTIMDQAMPVFGRAIRMGSQLAVLHLENSVASGRPLMILVAAIKMNEPLRELYLADNRLMPTDGLQLGNLLKFNHKLKLLDVRNNHLGDVGCGHIFDGLCEQTFGSGLSTLVLWNNQISYQVMHSLSRALRLTQSLETINLGHNTITNEGVHRMKEAVLFNKTLLRIGLQSSKLTCEGAVALAECIAESSRLLRMDLRENDIKTGGLMALSLSLRVNQSVTRVDLDQKSKRESSVRDYADQQRRLLAEIASYTQRNRTAGLQREEEERQRKLEQELQRAIDDTEDAVCHSEDEEEPIAATTAESSQANPQTLAESSNEPATARLEASVPSTSQETENETENKENVNELNNVETSMAEDETKTTPIASSLRLNLNLPVMSRSATLESPVESATSTEFPPIDVPETVHEERIADQCTDSNSPLAQELPPSPMVSSEGKTILAAALSESELLNTNTDVDIQAKGDGTEVSNTKQIPIRNTAPEISIQASSPQSTPHLTVQISSPTVQILQTEIVRTPSPGHSPNSRRKFTIRRVIENSSSMSPTTHSSASFSPTFDENRGFLETAKATDYCTASYNEPSKGSKQSAVSGKCAISVESGKPLEVDKDTSVIKEESSTNLGNIVDNPDESSSISGDDSSSLTSLSSRDNTSLSSIEYESTVDKNSLIQTASPNNTSNDESSSAAAGIKGTGMQIGVEAAHNQTDSCQKTVAETKISNESELDNKSQPESSHTGEVSRESISVSNDIIEDGDVSSVNNDNPSSPNSASEKCANEIISSACIPDPSSNSKDEVQDHIESSKEASSSKTDQSDFQKKNEIDSESTVFSKIVDSSYGKSSNTSDNCNDSVNTKEHGDFDADVLGLNGIKVDLISNGDCLRADTLSENRAEGKPASCDDKDEFEKELEDMLSVAFSSS